MELSRKVNFSHTIVFDDSAKVTPSDTNDADTEHSDPQFSAIISHTALQSQKTHSLYEMSQNEKKQLY